MSAPLTYTLEIRYPDDIDADTWDAILEEADVRDDGTPGKEAFTDRARKATAE